MPIALAPSHVFPEQSGPKMSTESHTAFVGKAVSAAYSQPYRGSPQAFVASNSVIMQQPGTVASELKSLGARLEALNRARAAPAPPTRAVAEQQAFPGGSYDSFAQYAAEASRVRNSGRLPFGSDSRKMA